MLDPWVQEMINDEANHPWFMQQRKEALELMEDCDKEIKRIQKDIRELKPPDGVKMILEVMIVKQIDEKELQLQVYRRFDNYIKRRTKPKGVDLDELKKNVPLTSVLPGKGIKNGNRIKYVCPLHKEDSPSFVWYINTHSFHCFGCQKSGTIIDLYMALNNVTVKEAIKELSKLV